MAIGVAGACQCDQCEPFPGTRHTLMVLLNKDTIMKFHFMFEMPRIAFYALRVCCHVRIDPHAAVADGFNS